jgi:hypothetical protein
MGSVVAMKIHYRKPTVLEQMSDTVRDSKKPIDYFEITSEELNSNYSNFDRATGKDNTISYSYKGIPIKVKQ